MSATFADSRMSDSHAVDLARRRMTGSVALALVIHAAVGFMLTGRRATLLELEPPPLVLTFVEPARRTEGPGPIDDEFRVARAPEAGRPIAAAEPPVAEVVEAPPPPDVPPPLETAPAPTAPKPPVVATLRPKPAPKPPAPAAKPAARTNPEPAARPQTDVAPNAGAALAKSGSPGEGSPSGTDAVSSAPSWAPAARIRYEELLFAWIDRHKQYPMIAQRRGIEGSGSVRIRIGRDGRLIERALVRSTGESMLDDAALEMVRRSSPFPAVPDDYSGSSFEFIAPVEYRLR